MRRPSHHEIFGKLKAASAAAENGVIRLVESLPILADMDVLNILAETLPALIPKLICEIGPEHYKGKNPPEKSYETVIEGCELFAFRWKSKALGCMMYFKFTLKDDAVWICSLHADRGERREGA